MLDTARWQCEGCQEKEANPKPTVAEDEEIRYKVNKTSKATLKIMQWNCEALSAKIEKLKVFF